MLGMVQTNCKSWRCRSCRDRKIGHVMGLMERGLSEVSEPCLLSVTYKSPGKLSEMVENPVGVERAKADWRAFMWFVKQRHPRLQWFKVPELTKRQLHWHALIGNLEPGSVDACEKKQTIHKGGVLRIVIAWSISGLVIGSMSQAIAMSSMLNGFGSLQAL